MSLTVDALPDRITAALLGAAAAEAEVGEPAGARQLLELAALLADDPDGLEQRAAEHGLTDQPATGPAGLLLRAVPIALLSPLDRPRLRRATHRAAVLAGADEGTAMTCVAVGCLAADLCRFDLETALTRLHQSLLEEAPMALLSRLRPLADHQPRYASGDPVDALQVAVSVLAVTATVPEAVAEAAAYDGHPAAAAVLAAALAGARSGLDGTGDDWLQSVPGRDRAIEAATALAHRALASLPQDPVQPPSRIAAQCPTPPARSAS